ncbi:cytochrome b [Arsukibacterium sp.]|uniref:cytochrome b n=1 Tax=Arsukibacterium sp. TaxID=1977258 RepID=UPI00299E73E7|nr:cytochrome b [Arsukibacterium sp.]MDX1677305.1 cytochrome b [Arsukibacterium sp.]
MLTNTLARYGLISIVFHWLVAVSVIVLFVVGYWMVDLNYYSSWYRTAPFWHKSIGILLFIVVILRLCWKAVNVTPAPVSSHSLLEQRLAKLAHLFLYLLLLAVMLSGYLISTADGRAIAVFNWFTLPGAGELFTGQADIAGVVHQYLAYSLIAVSALHAAAALKHHFIDNDITLKRMFGR